MVEVGLVMVVIGLLYWGSGQSIGGKDGGLTSSRATAVFQQMNTFKSAFNVQKAELGCGPTNIKGMIDSAAFRAGNTCTGNSRTKPFLGPYLSEAMGAIDYPTGSTAPKDAFLEASYLVSGARGGMCSTIAGATNADYCPSNGKIPTNSVVYVIKGLSDDVAEVTYGKCAKNAGQDIATAPSETPTTTTETTTATATEPCGIYDDSDGNKIIYLSLYKRAT